MAGEERTREKSGHAFERANDYAYLRATRVDIGFVQSSQAQIKVLLHASHIGFLPTEEDGVPDVEPTRRMLGTVEMSHKSAKNLSEMLIDMLAHIDSELKKDENS